MSHSPLLTAHIQIPLEKLQYSATPTPTDQINTMIKDQLGDLPDSMFDDWDPVPFAVGSIGQVHRGRLKTGEIVAIKVQHPNVQQAVTSDLRLLSFILPAIKIVWPRLDIRQLKDEIKTLILDETDYLKEAANLKLFRDLFHNRSDIKVPDVYPQYSASKVLTMEYVEGLSFQEFINEASDEQKSNAGRIIAQSAGRALFVHGVFNTAPHPGNYLFLPDGRVAFLDFGSVKHFDKNFLGLFKRWFYSVIAHDMKEFSNTTAEIYQLENPSGFDYQGLMAQSRSISDPFIHTGPFTIDQAYVDKIIDTHSRPTTVTRKLRPPIEATGAVRIAFGLLQILATLKTTADWRPFASPG